jgi:hypothetical protein
MARGASGVHADAERSFEGRQGAHRSNSVSAAGSLGLFGWLYRSSSENCGGSVNRHGPASSAWVGFTVSTGWGCQNHDILTWSFVGADTSSSMSVVFSDISFPMSACLPDRNLCTPEHAFVQYNGAGYHIVLPANLEWGASIPNSSGRAVVVTEAHGVVCWDLKAHGSEGCSGPSRNGPPAGAGFLAEDAPAGALIMGPREEHTWFSVNGRSGAGFKDNQGFYEFDLEIE